MTSENDHRVSKLHNGTWETCPWPWPTARLRLSINGLSAFTWSEDLPAQTAIQSRLKDWPCFDARATRELAGYHNCSTSQLLGARLKPKLSRPIFGFHAALAVTTEFRTKVRSMRRQWLYILATGLLWDRRLRYGQEMDDRLYFDWLVILSMYLHLWLPKSL